jgi:Gpi18-like mannosyltransferase
MSDNSPAPSPEQSPQRASFLTPLSILLVGRAGLWIVAYLGLVLIQGQHRHAPTRDDPANAFPGNLLLDGWVRWDSYWSARIAEHGYTNQSPDGSGQLDTGVLPLYPLAVRGVAKLVGGNVYLAGVLISNICFIAAGIVLYYIVLSRWGQPIAGRTIVLLSVYPFSYVYSAMYTESLFLLCVVLAFFFGERRWWIPAALCAAAAGATRLVGTATAVALIAMYIWDCRLRLRENWRRALWLLLGFAGIASYMLFLAIRFHQPLVFIRTHGAAGWGDFNSLASLRDTLKSWREASYGNFVSGNVPILLTIQLIAGVIATVLCIISWKKLPISYALWASLVLVMSWYRWGCLGRHVSTLFPLFIVAAMLLSDRRWYHALVYLSTLLLALLTIMFAQGIWVA